MPTLQLIPTPSRRPIITLRINGHEYRFLIDTGATHTVLDPRLLPELNKEQENTRRTRKCFAIDGVIHTDVIAVCFRFAGVVIQETMFHSGIHETLDNTVGLIGQDILQQFKSVTFDNVRRTVKFEL